MNKSKALNGMLQYKIIKSCITVSYKYGNKAYHRTMVVKSVYVDHVHMQEKKTK